MFVLHHLVASAATQASPPNAAKPRSSATEFVPWFRRTKLPNEAEWLARRSRGEIAEFVSRDGKWVVSLDGLVARRSDGAPRSAPSNAVYERFDPYRSAWRRIVLRSLGFARWIPEWQTDDQELVYALTGYRQVREGSIVAEYVARNDRRALALAAEYERDRQALTAMVPSIYGDRYRQDALPWTAEVVALLRRPPAIAEIPRAVRDLDRVGGFLEEDFLKDPIYLRLRDGGPEARAALEWSARNDRRFVRGFFFIDHEPYPWTLVRVKDVAQAALEKRAMRRIHLDS